MAARVRFTTEQIRIKRLACNKIWASKNRKRVQETANTEVRKESKRYGQIRYKYNLTKDQYLKLEKEQDYRCAICRRKQEKALSNNLYVDHEHNTGLVRGLLCRNCNSGIGSFKENLSIFDKAKEYLVKHIEENGIMFYSRD